MNVRPHFTVRLIGCVLVLLLSIATFQPTQATGTSLISVAPVWRPGTQLTTIPSGPGTDIRYVDAEIYVTSSVEFWAVEFNCTVTPSVLHTYTQDLTGTGTPNDPGDDVAPIRWGSVWNAYGTYIQTALPFNTSTGAMTYAASKTGNDRPMGFPSSPATFLAASVRYQVATNPGTSPFTCTSSFLDRNGVPVVTPTYTAPSSLKIITGYTISGNILYQSRTTKSGIGVSCFTPLPPSAPTQTYNAVTDSSGHFAIPTRVLGQYECKFFGNISNPSSSQEPDLYIQTETMIPLINESYTLLPVTLRGGNLDRETAGSETKIDAANDIVKITGNYHLTRPDGDVNGDGKTDKADLAITAGNIGQADGSDYGQHVLYGLPRLYSNNTPADHIWLGDTFSGHVTQFVSGTNRDFWPALSPNGTQLAFIRLVGGHHVLFVASITSATGTVGSATQLSSLTGEAFAPSWSPDGNKIAFIFSFTGAYPTGWQFNDGGLAMVDPTGKNLEYLNSNGLRIFPVAWLDNHTVLFAGNGNNGTTAGKIYSEDLSTEAFGVYDPSIPMPSDMPTVRGRDLFYRYDFLWIVMAEIQTNGPLPPFISNIPGAYHFYVLVNNQQILAAYFVVSPAGRNLLYTTDLTGFTFYTTSFQLGSFPYNWGVPYNNSHAVDDFLGNPPWDQVASHATNLWGEQETFDWEP